MPDEPVPVSLVSHVGEVRPDRSSPAEDAVACSTAVLIIKNASLKHRRRCHRGSIYDGSTCTYNGEDADRRNSQTGHRHHDPSFLRRPLGPAVEKGQQDKCDNCKRGNHGSSHDFIFTFENTEQLEYKVENLADIPAQSGVNNVYGDVGQLFATTLVAEPNVCAALMGTLIKGLGVDRICWGTDALWTGAPQWQIEGLQRLEIPEAMQKKFGYAPLGAADGPVKTAIFGGNNARLYNIQPKRAMLDLKGDRLAMMKAQEEYEKAGPGPSNTRYGYVVRPGQ